MDLSFKKNKASCTLLVHGAFCFDYFFEYDTVKISPLEDFPLIT